MSEPDLNELYKDAIKLKDEGRLDESTALLEQIVQKDENFAIAYSALAVNYTQLGAFERAIAAAQRVCQLEPNDPFSYTALSVTLQRAGRIPEAEAAMAQARQLQWAARQ